jgi:hypothetical protein
LGLVVLFDLDGWLGSLFFSRKWLFSSSFGCVVLCKVFPTSVGVCL